ncbi:MAG: hypothetical protein U1F65_09895 [Verrucomicrobiota bacterium]
MKNRFCLAIGLLACLGTSATAQTTAFTYQGQLMTNTLPASGSNDLRFVLFDDPAAGSQISTNITVDDVVMTNGLFTVTLDWEAPPSSTVATAGSKSVSAPAAPPAPSPPSHPARKSPPHPTPSVRPARGWPPRPPAPPTSPAPWPPPS